MTEQSRRWVWCSTKDRVLHGRAYRKPLENPNFFEQLLGKRYHDGTFYELDKLDLQEALASFREFLKAPGDFKIECRDGNSIDFAYAPDRNLVGLDCWLDADLDTAVVSVEDAERVLAFIYEDSSDQAIAELIKSIELR